MATQDIEVAPPADLPGGVSEPVETQKVESTEAKTDEIATQPEENRDDKGRFKGVQTRIDELTRARREAEREAAYWRGLAAPKKEEEVDAKPVIDTFGDYSAYVEALTEWKAARAVKDQFAGETQRKAQDATASAFLARQDEVRKVVPDYDTVMADADAPVASHVQEVMLDSAVGPQLAYHFAKNPSLLESLNAMTPLQAAREIGAMESGLKAPAKKLSSTPAPANTAPASGRANTKSLEDMTMDEYKAHRKANGARWAR